MKKLINLLSVVSITVLCVFHYQFSKSHSVIANMADTKKMERNLFSENGFYYLFYKKILRGEDIRSDNSQTYPETVNAVKKYRILPERIFAKLVSKSSNPFEFLAKAELTVYCLSLASLLVFIFLKTGHILAPIIFYFFYFINIDFITRFGTNPFLKEHVGFTFFCLSVFTTCLYLKFQKKYALGILSILLSIFIASWQLSHLLLLLFYTPIFYHFLRKKISKEVFNGLILAGLCAHLIAWILSDFSMEILINSSFILLVAAPLLNLEAKSKYLLSSLTFLGLKLIVFWGGSNNYDSHIISFLKDKFLGVTNFHSALYLLTPTFQTMDLYQFRYFLESGFLILVLFNLYRLFENKRKLTEAQVFAYVISYGLLFVSLFIQRFLVLSIPLVLLVSLEDYFAFYAKGSKKKTAISFIIIFLFYFFNSYKFLRIGQQFQEVSPQEEKSIIIDMIKNTSNNIIASDMTVAPLFPILDAGKSVINPHYEDSLNREKTYQTYKVYGFFKEEDIHKIHQGFGTTHLVITKFRCQQNTPEHIYFLKAVHYQEPQNSTIRFCDRDFKDSKYFKTLIETINFKVLTVQKI